MFLDFPLMLSRAVASNRQTEAVQCRSYLFPFLLFAVIINILNILNQYLGREFNLEHCLSGLCLSHHFIMYFASVVSFRVPRSIYRPMHRSILT